MLDKKFVVSPLTIQAFICKVNAMKMELDMQAILISMAKFN